MVRTSYSNMMKMSELVKSSRRRIETRVMSHQCRSVGPRTAHSAREGMCIVVCMAVRAELAEWIPTVVKHANKVLLSSKLENITLLPYFVVGRR